MIYIDTNKIVEGRAHKWRIFADTPEELSKCLSSISARNAEVLHGGEPNEHAIISTVQKNKIKGATEVNDFGKVKLIRRKRRLLYSNETLEVSEASEALAEYEDDPEASKTLEDVAEELQPSLPLDEDEPPRGGIKITTKPADKIHLDNAPYEDDDEGME